MYPIKMFMHVGSSESKKESFTTIENFNGETNKYTSPFQSNDAFGEFSDFTDFVSPG